MGSTSRRAKPTELTFITWRGGTSSPRQTASSATTPGIGGRLPATACGAGLRRLSRRSLHRQGARHRPRRRHHDCAGGIRDRGRQSPYPGASSRACPQRCRDRCHQAGARYLWQSLRACPLRPRAAWRAQSANGKSSPPIGPWVLRSGIGRRGSKLRQAKRVRRRPTQGDDEAQRHRASLRRLGAECRDGARAEPEPQARALPKSGSRPSWSATSSNAPSLSSNPRTEPMAIRAGQRHDLPDSIRPKIDKSVLTIGEPKRIRCKEHLRFVASQPCVICGRSPSHAHHVRYAQSTRTWA